MNWKCAWGFHKWAKWVDATYVVNRGGTEYDRLAQNRICETCGLKDMRFI